MNKRILAAFTAIAVAASTLTFMSFADDSNTKGGVPIRQGTFEEDTSLFSNRSLGVANDFHLFAFDTIDLQAHCNGNFAAPNVKAPQASGTASGSLGNTDKDGVGTDPDMPNEVSLATKSLELDADCKVDYLFFPTTVDLYDEVGTTLDNPESKATVDSDGTVGGNKRIKVGTDGTPHQINGKIGYVENSYMDFAGKYHSFYNNMSNEIAAFDNSKPAEGITYVNVTEDEKHDGHIKLADSGISVLNITIDKLNTYQNGFNIDNVKTVEDNDGDKRPDYVMSSDGKTSLQTLIINLDVGKNGPVDFNAELKVNRTVGGAVNNEEANALDGTIILWNIYNSNDENNLYTGEFTFRKNLFGSVLAPSATIVASGSGMNGNVIANKIETHAESHRCDFIGALPSFTSTTPGGDEDDDTDETTPQGTPTPGGDENDDTDETTPQGTPTPGGDENDDTDETTPQGTPTPGEDENDDDTDETTPQGTPTPGGNVDDDSDNNGTTTTTTVPVASPESTTTTANDGVADDGDDNGKTTTTSTTTTTAHNEGVADGGDGNDRDTGMGSDGDNNNRPPKTGDSAPAALAVALIGSAIVITALKKNKDK